MSSNLSLGTDTQQQQKAAARRVLHAGHALTLTVD